MLAWKINQPEVTRVALVPISRELHGKTRIRPLSSFAYIAKATLAPLYGSEIVLMSHEVPVVFIREADTFTLNALIGLRPGQNLMLDPQGRWMGSHVPAILRRGPFRLGQVDGEQEPRMVLCLEDSSDLISETEGQPLFDESGAPTPLINEATTLLSQLARDIPSTQAICAGHWTSPSRMARSSASRICFASTKPRSQPCPARIWCVCATPVRWP